MVADTIHLKTHSPLHPVYNILGQEIGMYGKASMLITVVDLPIPTLILASFGIFFLGRIFYSIARLALELTVIPGKNVSVLL